MLVKRKIKVDVGLKYDPKNSVVVETYVQYDDELESIQLLEVFDTSIVEAIKQDKIVEAFLLKLIYSNQIFYSVREMGNPENV